LNYAPSGAPAVAAEEPAVVAPPVSTPVDEVRGALREGRAKLKESNGAAALVFFKARSHHPALPLHLRTRRTQRALT
jgi:hypothetical protein